MAEQATYPGSIPTHSCACGRYTFPAVLALDLAATLGARALPEAARCTHGGKRRRDTHSGCLVEGSACGEPAAWGAIWLPSEGRMRPRLYRPGVLLCDRHAREKARARGIPLLATRSDYDRYLAETARFQRWHEARVADARAAAQAQWQQEAQAREQEVLARDGRVLRLSGYRGRLFARSDGGLECELHDGTRVVPCCWLEGARLIDHRVGGRAASGHTPGCPEAA